MIPGSSHVKIKSDLIGPEHRQFLSSSDATFSHDMQVLKTQEINGCQATKTPTLKSDTDLPCIAFAYWRSSFSFS
jgi:hypothetical protein